MAAIHQRAACAVPVSDAIEFIVFKAAQPDGVSLAQIADFCETGNDAAKNRLAAAMESQPLLRAQQPADIGGRAMDVRWFLHQHHADMFTAGRQQPSPATAGPRTAVQVVKLFDTSPEVRPGADDHRQWGSRRGDRIHYADGRVANFSET
jgi:hypothetical protein